MREKQMKKDWRGFEPQLVEVSVDISRLPAPLSYEEPVFDIFATREDIHDMLEKHTGERLFVARGADIKGFDFSGLDLRRFCFIGCDLSHADFRGANIEGANFTGSDLTGALITPRQLASVSGLPQSLPKAHCPAYRLHRIKRRTGCTPR